MRFIFLNQFYPPDFAPTGKMMEVVVARLVADGHEVEVWCSGGSYVATGAGASASPEADEPKPGVSVVRLGKLGSGKSAVGKLLRWLGFYAMVAARLLGSRGKCDRLVALTTPPFLSVLARVGAWRHDARHSHWIMDLYPDALVAHGMARDRGLAHRALVAMAKFGFGGQRVGAVVTLGPCMAERARQYATREVEWVPLWGEVEVVPLAKAIHALPDPESGLLADPVAMHNLRTERGWTDEEVVLLYSGNLGRGHMVTPLLDAALALHEAGVRNLRWVFTSHGPRSLEVSAFHKRHREVPLEFMNPVKLDLLAAHLVSADIHLASLEPAWGGCMVPSKIQGSFAVGRPVMFVGPVDSSPARWIGASDGGWVVDGSDPVSGLMALLRRPEIKDEAARRGLKAWEYSKANFDREANATKLAAIFAADSGPARP